MGVYVEIGALVWSQHACNVTAATGPCRVMGWCTEAGVGVSEQSCAIHIAPFEHVHNHMHTLSHAGVHHMVLQYTYTDVSSPAVVYHLHTRSCSTTK